MSSMTPLPQTAKELAEYLQTDLFNLRNQLEAANGQINFDKATDQLNAEQLAKWLPRYLVGRGQMKGEKRQRIESLLAQLNSNEKPTEPEQPIKNEPIKAPIETQVKQKRPIKSSVLPEPIEQPQPEQSRPERWIFLAVAILAVLWQASHFAHLEAMDSQIEIGFRSLVAWGIALGFESLALLLTVFSNKRNGWTWFWLIGFALVAVFMNLSFYGVIETPVFRKVVLSIALPFSIVATTHLFISNNRK